MPRARFPKIGEHTAILGTTGSGKTQYAAYQISRAPFHMMPWFILDYKGDDLLNSISRIKEIGLNDRLTRHPGLYILHARPDQQEQVEDWFRRLWEHEEAGLYIDEGYLAPDKSWLRNLLAQGRSKHISVTVTSQRPVDVPRSIFTEAGIVSVFRLNDEKDYQRVREFTPRQMLETRLPDFHSFWYSSRDHKADDPIPYAVVGPVPKAQEIVDTIDFRLTPKTRVT